MQRLLRDNVESEGDEVFDDIRSDGLFDCGCDTNNAGTTAVDCKCATDPSYRVACLSFGEGYLEIKGPPDQHHEGDVQSSFGRGSVDAREGVVHVTH